MEEALKDKILKKINQSNKEFIPLINDIMGQIINDAKSNFSEEPDKIKALYSILLAKIISEVLYNGAQIIANRLFETDFDEIEQLLSEVKNEERKVEA